jgi:hypothetical protein
MPINTLGFDAGKFKLVSPSQSLSSVKGLIGQSMTGKKKGTNDGSSAALAAASAADLILAGKTADGVYWINLPTVGPTQVYCILNTAVDGGGWMMAMKATRGTTFNYGASYWTTVGTLNPTDTTRNDADAKFDSMNYFSAKDIMANWPDLTQGGDLSVSGYGTVWIENNFNAGTRTTPISFFNTVSQYNYNGTYVRSAKWNGGSQFSSQSGYQAYGFNRTDQSNARTRWGWSWNNEGSPGSNDVSGGIGMDSGFGSYSAGDLISCCNDVAGFNRSARVEIYVR